MEARDKQGHTYRKLAWSVRLQDTDGLSAITSEHNNVSWRCMW